MKLNSLSNRAFTLIELLVVVAIIGILASVVLASMNSARKKSRDARRAADAHTLWTALQLFYDDHGCLPRTTGSTCVTGYSESNFGGMDTSDIGLFLPFLAEGNYLPSIPVDPLNTSTSRYRYFCYADTDNGVVNHPAGPGAILQYFDDAGVKHETYESGMSVCR